MNTVAEKLAESWLDSQTERRYQSAFIQLLVAEGWTVLHNTRHSPLEFGKDVIARDPNGQLHAIQLKGNPGSRLTKSQAQAMLPQVIELVDVPVVRSYQADAGEKHIAVIVTNGEIDEEAVTEFELVARRCENPYSPCSRLELWARGNLLSRILTKIDRIWPSTLEGIQSALDVYRADGRSIPDKQGLSDLLVASIGLPNTSMKSPEKTSRLASLFLFGEIVKFPAYNAQNHYALYELSVMIGVFGLRYADSAGRLAMVQQYSQLGLEHAAALLAEAKERDFDPAKMWAERDVLAEVDIMKDRARLIADAASALVLAGHRSPTYPREYARLLIEGSFIPGSGWGNAMIPSALLRYWAFRRLDGTFRPDALLRSLLTGMLQVSDSKKGDGPNAFAAPYYGFEQCLYNSSNGRFGLESDLQNDNVRGRLWFARAMLFMLAKRNWKQWCKQVWAPFSKRIHEEMCLPKPVFFDARLSDEGVTRSFQYYDKTWAALISEALDTGEADFLNKSKQMAWLIAAYLSIVPYRAWTPVIMWLDEQLCRTWYHKGHLPSTT